MNVALQITMKKNTIILALVFLALLAAAYLVTMKPGEQSVSTDAGNPLVEIDSAAVDKLEIRAPNSIVILVKQGTEWFLQVPLSYKASQTNVANALQQTKSMKVKNIVSSNAEKHNLFQVDSTGTTVTVYENGAQKAAFILGKPGPSFSDNYARLVSSADVALVGGANSYTFNKPMKDWRDQTIFASPKELITSVLFQYGDTAFSLAFKDSTWTIGNDSVDASAVQSFLSSLSSVEADEFVDTLITPQPKMTAQISVGDVQLRFHETKDRANYYVQSSASRQWYEIQPWRANQLLKRKKDLVKK
ncbi:MAG TPA: DUF4340 domain-containing protein [Bacteroidota bacterium]